MLTAEDVVNGDRVRVVIRDDGDELRYTGRVLSVGRNIVIDPDGHRDTVRVGLSGDGTPRCAVVLVRGDIAMDGRSWEVEVLEFAEG